LEVQQNSDTTYRIYDWGRVGDDGKPRQTHVRRAVQVINWDIGLPAALEPRRRTTAGRNSLWDVLKAPYFHVSRWDLSEPQAVANDGRSFHALFVAAGTVDVEGNGLAETIDPGTSCLLPAALKQYTLTPVNGESTLVHISLV